VKVKAGMVTVSVEEAQAALQLAAERGAAAGAELAGAEFAKAAEAAVAAVVAEKAEEKAAALADLAATKEAEKEAVVATLTLEIGNVEEVVADVTGSAVAAERALNARISSLKQQLGGGCWLDAVSNARRAADSAKASHAAAAASNAQLEAKAKELQELVQLGPKMRANGAALGEDLSSEAAIRRAGLLDELEQTMPQSAAEVGLTDRRVDQLLRHIEAELLAAGDGDVSRTRLLAASVFQRPVLQRLLATSPAAGRAKARVDRLNSAARAMTDQVRQTLKQLTGSRGSRTHDDHVRFESIVTAMIPEDATSEHMLRAIEELLGITWRQIDRAQRRQLLNDGLNGGFARATTVSRGIRKDKNTTGRHLCRLYWHEHTRFDTNSRKKRRIHVAKNTYIEHWRRIQYDTNQQMYDAFMGSREYREYRAQGGVPISESVFFQEKCKCIVKADHEECACPICTQMHEILRDWHRQREVWHRESTCNCGSCEAKSQFREASKDVHHLNSLLLCEHHVFPSLQIDSGPHSCEEVKFRRRQCCQVPLLDRKGEKIKDSCNVCGWDKRMPACPVECSAADPAEWKEYCARGPSSSGNGNQEDLVTVRGTRAEMMAQIKKIYEQWLPHHWIKRWCEHQRHLTYATFGVDEACIMTDFSAVYDHKAFCSKCCEQPHHSNMDVFVVSWAHVVDGKREVSGPSLALALALAA
jgi:hypothetical protein